MCFPTSVGGLDGPAIDLVEGASAPFMLRWRASSRDDRDAPRASQRHQRWMSSADSRRGAVWWVATDEGRIYSSPRSL